MSSRTLKFATEHHDPILRGFKKITIRKYRPEAHDFRAREMVVADCGLEEKLLIRMTVDTLVKKFDDLTDQEAQDDGFRDKQEALAGLQSYYPDLNKDTKIAIIRFEMVDFFSS